jgi:ATP-dependent helicase YprA (DUF1998 family)
MARKRAKKKPRKVQAPIDESESDSSSNSRISIPLESDGDSDGSFSEQDTDDPQYIQALRKASDEQLRAILEERTERITGMKPRPFQTDSALSLHKHTDLILVAGTGFGKTLAFVMPCFLWKRNVVLILSPLNALQDEQVSPNLLIINSDYNL